MSVNFKEISSAIDEIGEIANKTRSLIRATESLLPQLGRIWHEQEEKAEAIAQRVAKREIITIALLGSTGTGKSSLLNALLGAPFSSPILPKSGVGVCTAAIAHVRYADIDGFRVTVEFTSKSNWQDQLTNARNEWLAKKQDSGTGKFSSDEYKPRLIGVYGSAEFERFMSAGELDELSLDDALHQAMIQESQTFAVEDTASLRTLLEQYLKTPQRGKDVQGRGHWWPIVESVLIEGRFAALEFGAELVDLPGLNDPNKAREERTESFLALAKFVMIAFNTRSKLGKDIRDVLRRPDLLDNMILAGKENALTFVGTATDAFDPDEDEEIYGDGFHTLDLQEKALVRNKFLAEQFQELLKEIAEDMISERNLDGTYAEKMRESITGSRLFLTSANNYMKLLDETLGKKNSQQNVFTNESDTQINLLLAYLRDVSINRGPVAIAEGLKVDLSNVLRTIESQLRMNQQAYEMRHQERSDQIKLVRERILALSNDLTKEVEAVRNSYKEYLQQSAVKLSTEVLDVDTSGMQRIARKIERDLIDMHWQTLRATSRHGGRYYSKTFGSIDFYKFVSQPIKNSTIGPWETFFSETVHRASNDIVDGLLGVTETAVHEMKILISSAPELSFREAGLNDMLDSVNNSVGTDVNAMTQAIEQAIRPTKVAMIKVVDTIVENLMQPAILAAQSEYGKGMKDRMVHTLSAMAATAVREVLNEVSVALSQSLNSALTVHDGIVGRSIGKLVSQTDQISEMFKEQPEVRVEIDMDILKARIAESADLVRGVEEVII